MRSETKKNHRSLPHQKRKHRLTKYPEKVQDIEGRPLLEQKAEIRAESSSKERARTRHVIIGTLPCVSISCLKQDVQVNSTKVEEKWW